MYVDKSKAEENVLCHEQYSLLTCFIITFVICHEECIHSTMDGFEYVGKP